MYPYVSALPNRDGLGQGGAVPAPSPATTPTDPLWARLVAAFGTPFAQAASSRLAYGQTYPPYGGGFYYQSPSGQYTGTGYGGFSPSTLLLLGGGLLLVMMLSK